ncbi:MAG: cyclodeaminase/cyclohydrolase family protein [Promethearchaeota archaeon]
MLKDLKVQGFIEELASDSPAPGGGSAACVAGAMGAALGAMVSRLTVGKKGYESVNAFFEEQIPKLDKLHHHLTELIDEDANAFTGVIKAFKMPKDTEDNKRIRSKKIQEEYKKAALIPMTTVRTCKEVLDILFEMGVKGNKNALSDVAVGALSALTGLKSAALNVEINLPSIKDETFKSEMEEELSSILSNLDEKVNVLVKEAHSNF